MRRQCVRPGSAPLPDQFAHQVDYSWRQRVGFCAQKFHAALYATWVGQTKPRSIAEMTDKLPGFFEGTEMPTAGWWEALWPDPAGVLAKVGLQPGMDVIDLCSGDGWFTLPIARIASHVAAIDIDPAML